jgi:chemotaxis protein CheD
VRESVVKVADWAAGAMAHVLLPSKSLAHDYQNAAKFPETAVPLLIDRLSALGADPRRLVAKLAGGASMFAALMTPGTIQMGERNVVAARSALRTAAIPIIAEAVGGDRGRTVRFHLDDGQVEIRVVGADVVVL